MCIIAYKKEGAALPSESILETCFYNNPDGAGIAIMRPRAQKVEIHKGFMGVSSFIDFVSSAVDVNDCAAYHFRISTSGGTNPYNCHPFPISKKVEDLKALETNSRFAFIHNGVIGQGEKSLSDTQVYVRDVLSNRNLAGLPQDIVKTVEKETDGSRTLLFDAVTHKVAFTGNWITDEKTGLLFSNTSYTARHYALFDNSPADDYDIKPCPHCDNWDTDLVSIYHNLFECPICNCLYDGKGEIWAAGEKFNESY